MSNTDPGETERYRSKALEGVNLLEFCWALAGPFIGIYFAANGATVVRIESTRRPDPARLAVPYKDGIPGINRSAIFAYQNANKYSIAVDLRHRRAMEVVTRLVSWADIVTENFAPGRMEEMGLSYEKLRKIKDDIIFVRVSIMGQTGPQSRLPGFGIGASAVAGITELVGWPERTPSTPVAGYCDVILPRFGTAIALAALDYKRRTGKGQVIDIAQNDATAQFLAPTILDYTVNRRIATRRGNQSPYAVPHNAYRCAGDDRWCVISICTDQEWQDLCRVINEPELAAKPGFITFVERKKQETEIDRLIQDWTINFSAEQVASSLQEAGVSAGVVENAEDLLHDPHLGRFIRHLEHKEIGTTPNMGQAFTFARQEAQPAMPSPLLGEHTEYVCREFLRMSDEEFIELLTAGVFE